MPAADSAKSNKPSGCTLSLLRRFMGRRKDFTLPALEKIYHRLLEIDEAAKTSQVTLDLALDMLVVELTA